MRFSASLQHILRQAQAPRPPGPVAAEQPAQPQQVTTELPQELPADLDQRVRLIGEW
jgi:hypothetical protein